MPKHDVRTRRYLELIDQLADEAGRKHGWKKRAADRLGVHQSYITKLESGNFVSIGPEAADAAARNLGMSPAYFRSERPVPYRDFVVSTEVLAGSNDVAFDAALARADGWVSQHVRHVDASEARHFAIDLAAWAEAEFARVNAFRAEAKAMLVASDAEVQTAAPALAFTFWQQYGIKGPTSPKRVLESVKVLSKAVKD